MPVETNVGEETPSDDLRSILEAAVTEVETSATEAATNAEKTRVTSANDAEKTEKTSATEADSNGRKRGADGKFIAAGESESEAAAKPLPKANTEKVQDVPAAAETPKTDDKTVPAQDPTARWSAPDKELFKTLPPAAQELITRRYKEMEGDYTKKTQAIADFRRTFEPVEKLFEPFKPQLKAQGWTEATLIKAWADVEKDLMEGRGTQRVLDIIKTYRLPVDDIAKALGLSKAGAPPVQQSAATGGTGSEPALDPAVVPLLEKQFGAFAKPLMDQLTALSTAEQQRQATAQRFEQQRVANEQTAATQKVTDFVNEVGNDGSPSHPYFHDVANHMVALSKAEREAGRTPDLQAIYDQAVWAHPQTREKLLAADKVAQAEKSRQESLTKTAQARKAATSVTGAPGAGHASKAGTSTANKSLREIIAEAADAVADA